MWSFLRNELDSIRSALWFRPTSFCLVAVFAALGVAVGDEYLLTKLFSLLPEIDRDTLRELLRLVAGSMLTVSTVMLSVLMLVLSLVSGQASPRAVPELLADKVTQNALGTFLGSFVFSLSSLLLLSLNTISQAGVTLTFIATLVLVASSVRYLVQWIHHVADAMKLNQIVSSVHCQAAAVLDNYVQGESDSHPPVSGIDIDDGITVQADATGFVQLVDEKALIDIADCAALKVEMLVREGTFVHPHLPLMRLASPTSMLNDEEQALIAKVRSCIVTGSERSSENDPLLGFELLAEIACRSLSSGINDPRTALACIDHIGALLACAAVVPSHRYPSGFSADGRIKFKRPDFRAFLISAVRPVVRDGASTYEVIEAIIRMLLRLSEIAHADYADALSIESERAMDFGLLRLELAQDKQALADFHS